MKLSKIEVQQNFSLFAICVQISYGDKEHRNQFVSALRTSWASLSTVEDAQNALVAVAKTHTNISILQILTGKPDFWTSTTTPRKILSVPEDLVRFPVKAAKLAQETLCGPLRFTITQVYSEELDKVSEFVRSNPNMTAADFALAVSAFCSALPGVHVYGLQIVTDRDLDLPLRNTSLVETLPYSIPRDEAEMIRIGNFFKSLGESHLVHSMERVRNAFYSRVFTESVIVEVERVFQALGRKLDLFKSIQSDLRSNLLIEATACFLTSQRLMIKARSMRVVPEPAQAQMFGSSRDMQAAEARGELKPIVVEERAQAMPTSVDPRAMPTSVDPRAMPTPVEACIRPETPPKRRIDEEFEAIVAKEFTKKVVKRPRKIEPLVCMTARSRKAPERFGY